MKFANFLFLALIMSSVYADEIGERIAYSRSNDLVEMIAKGEKLRKKAIEYGDAEGFLQAVSAPMARKLQWWSELQQKHPKELEAYVDCRSAGSEFNRYGSATFDQPSLSRDSLIEVNERNYRLDLASCRKALIAGKRRLHT